MAILKYAKIRLLVAAFGVLGSLAAVTIAIGVTSGAKSARQPVVPAPIRDAAALRETSLAGNAQAQLLCTSGRFGEAFAAYRAGRRDGFACADLLALGLALLDRDRIVLGWAALEAAHRIDPANARGTLALDRLQAKLSLAHGRERLVLHDAASRVELLSAVPGGQPLGMLVLGIAGLADDPACEQEFLDRLAIRDRSAFQGIVSVDGAVKLVARLLLEAGQPARARELLGELIAPPRSHSDVGPSRGDRSLAAKPDREAAWLLSRVALQLGDDEAADAMLELAGGFGQGPNPPAEPAPFAGSKRCRDCHRFLYRQEQRASRHAHTLGLGAALRDVPLPSQAVADPHVPGLSHTLTRKNGGQIEVESRMEGRVAKAIVEYALGSGHHGVTMVARDEQGIERELRISYFGEVQSWGETKGIMTAPREAADQIGLALAPKPLRRCLHCHSTWFGAVNLGRPAPKGPEASDHGIGCERCHGPGLNHIKAVESGFAEVAIALSARSAAAAKLASCTECHASDGSIEPSDPEFTRAQGTTLLFSRCYTRSAGQLGCVTCHDPHRALDRTIAHYDAKCLLCHGQMPPKAAETAAHSVPIVDRSKPSPGLTCPVNAAGNCVSCHMPKVETGDRRSRFTDHHIRVHRG